MTWVILIGILVVVVLAVFVVGENTREDQLVFWYFGPDLIIVKSNKMAVVFKAKQFANFKVAPTDRKGNPAKVQPGSVEYSSPDGDVIVEEDPNDETLFKVTTAATEVTESRTVDIAVSADADLGDGVKTISGTLTIVLEPETAEGFGVTTVTEPQDVTDAPPVVE